MKRSRTVWLQFGLLLVAIFRWSIAGRQVCDACSESSSALGSVAHRGGGGRALHDAERTIRRFLDEVPTEGGEFHVQGWRWHTMSLVREARRLQQLALSLTERGALDDEDRLHSLQKASDYVVGFNMKGLHKTEKELFFPWARKTVKAKNADLGKAFEMVMDALDSERKKIEKLGNSLNERVLTASIPSLSQDARSKAVSDVAAQAAGIAEGTHSMLEREDALLVPIVSRLVPEKEQKSFNNQVIRKLGVLDSRLHLVGMHEAVWDLKDESERALFNEAIPAIPRMMIPRWKRLLYDTRFPESS